MSDFLYAEAGRLTPTNANLSLNLLNTGLRPATEAFVENIKKIRHFWQLTPDTMEIMHVHTREWRKTLKDLLGRDHLSPEEAEDAELIKELSNTVRERIQERYDKTDSLKEAADYDLDRGVQVFSEYVKRTKQLDQGVRSILENQLTAAWTAFEALAEDIWNAAKVVHPGFMGSKGYFRRLETIKQAYATLLPVRVTINGYYKAPVDDINAMFDRPDLRKLNLVRHVIVHKAGIVDQRFLEDAAAINWQVTDQLNAPIQIDGRRVKDLINPAIEAGQLLIRSVDGWMHLKTLGY